MVLHWAAAGVLALLLAYTCLRTLDGTLPTTDPRPRPTHVYVR